MSPDALSISVPNDPSFTGTWNGDVLINSNDLFDAKHLDLFAVMLHEAGHVFGLDHSTDPNSPMFANSNGVTVLTSGDIANLQALYGPRSADSHEGSSGNDTSAIATQFQPPGGYHGDTPLVEFGDLTTARDVDVYALRPPLSQYRGPITVRLQTAGISLLEPQLTILDAQGKVLGQAQAASGFGDVVTVRLPQSVPGAVYYLRVAGATHDVYDVGHYGLAVTLDGLSTTSTAAIDSVLRGDYETLNSSEIDAIIRNPTQALFRDDHHSDDGVLSATVLAPSPGFIHQSSYETIASISDPTDTDYYRIQGPGSGGNRANVLTVSIRAIDPNGAAPRVTLLDSEQRPITSRILANGNGLYTIQAAGLKSGGNVFLRVSGAGNPARVGNYGLSANYGTAVASPVSFATGNVSAAAPVRSGNLYVARAQLFQFLLSSTTAATPAVGVTMTIVNASGSVVFTLTAPAGDEVSGPSVLLTPGAYRVLFNAMGPAGVPAPLLTFQLDGDVISEPMGPTLADPTLTPIYSSPSKLGGYVYPNGIASSVPYWIGAIL